MSRLTPEWTPTLEGAYGANGAKGRAAELLYAQHVANQGMIAHDRESDYHDQVSGIDFIVQKGDKLFTVDVKGNLNNKRFYVEVGPRGWLFNPKKISEFIIHIDINTHDAVLYKRKDMQQFVTNNASEYRVYTDQWGNRTILLYCDNIPSFINMKKLKI
jgi:hypothetical protein